MKKRELDLGDFSKIELMLGLSDGDKFKINTHPDKFYQYNKSNGKITDDNGESISSELLLELINNPGIMENQGGGLNTYQLMNSMVARYFGLSSMFGLIAIVLFILLKIQVAFSGIGLIMLLLMAINIAGAGVMAGVLVTKLLLNKEMFL